MSIRLLFINLFFLLSLSGKAQIEQSAHFEIPIGKKDEVGFNVASIKKNGAVFFRMVLTEGSDKLQVIHTDTAFQIKWNGLLPVDRNFVLVNQTTTPEYLFLIFIKQNSRDHNFHLYQLELKSGNYVKHIIRNSIPFLPTTLETNDKGVLVGGYFAKVPVILYYSITQQQAKILPGLLNEPGTLSQIKINPDKTFDVLIGSKNYKKQKTLWLKNYDPQGALLRNLAVASESNSNFIFGQTVQTEDAQLIAGLYGKGGKTEYSCGFFISNIKSGSEQKTQYYGFTDLKNYFKYLPQKKEKRFKERFERKKMSGKQISFEHRVIVHEFVPYKNYFILIAEAFSPTYKRRNDVLGGALFSGNIEIFDGYKYSHSIILGVSKEGKLLWDNIFEMNDVRTFIHQQFVKMDMRKEEIGLLYLTENKIQTKIIRDSSVVKGKTNNPVQMKLAEGNDYENNTQVDKLDYWYDHNFLTYGIQDILIPTRKGLKPGKVFFAKKVRYAR